jgi:RND family efflux transporter MFP subunit
MNVASFTLRFIVTLVMVAVASLVAWQFWVYYMEDPWTRDGKVRADIVEMAPDVSGLVVQVFAHDNQVVHEGDPLFQIDPARFELALRQAKAVVAKTQAAMEDAQRTATRYATASNNAVSSLSRDQTSSSSAAEAVASYQQAQADEAVAELNLQRTMVRASVNGTVTNFSMRPGNHVTVGNAVLALVDSDSLYVDGYFEETKLRQTAVGDPARITLMDGGPAISGHVAGFAAAIADSERDASPNLMADVIPTFTWVRPARAWLPA